MIDSMLVAYVRQEVERGTPLYRIARTLIENKWTVEEIEHAVTAVTGQHFSARDHIHVQGTPLPSIGTLYATAYRLLRERWVRILGVAVVWGLFFLAGPFFVSQLDVVARAVATIFFATTFQLMTVLASYVVMVCIMLPAQVTWKELLRRSLLALIPLFWTGILFRSALLGGAIMLLIPAFIMLVSYSLWPYIVIDERVSGSRALVRSYAFIGEARAAFVLRWLVGGGVSFVLFVGLTAIESMVQYVVIDVVLTVFTIFIYAFFDAYGYALYQAVKERYTGAVRPTSGHRVFVIIAALLPFIMFTLGTVILSIFFVHLLKQFIG